MGLTITIITITQEGKYQKIRMNFTKKVGISLLEIRCPLIIRKIKNDMLARRQIMSILRRGNIIIMNSTKRLSMNSIRKVKIEPMSNMKEWNMKAMSHPERDHSNHHAHMLADFKRRFIVSLVLTIPVLLLSPIIQSFFGFELYVFGVDFINFLFPQ